MDRLSYVEIMRFLNEMEKHYVGIMTDKKKNTDHSYGRHGVLIIREIKKKFNKKIKDKYDRG
jgi:hypothetical protein